MLKIQDLPGTINNECSLIRVRVRTVSVKLGSASGIQPYDV